MFKVSIRDLSGISVVEEHPTTKIKLKPVRTLLTNDFNIVMNPSKMIFAIFPKNLINHAQTLRINTSYRP